MRNLAPIILFVYNRPWHTQQTIKALQKNQLAKDSQLFIYSDAPKNKDAIKSVQEVREYIKSINGFAKITTTERDKNFGLADSIVDGVTEIVNQFGKVIVLEDDIVTSPYFLQFMNNALDFYKNKDQVWHISGWNYPISNDDLEDVFLWRLMNCWGWATWADRWKFYQRDIGKTMKDFDKKDIYKFNLDGTEDFWQQIIANKKQKIKTWAVFWYATIFKNNGLCLNPSYSFVKNIGHDSSGENCGKTDSYKNIYLNVNQNIKFSKKIKENELIVSRVKQFYNSLKKPLCKRLISKVLKLWR